MLASCAHLMVFQSDYGIPAEIASTGLSYLVAGTVSKVLTDVYVTQKVSSDMLHVKTAHVVHSQAISAECLQSKLAYHSSSTPFT